MNPAGKWRLIAALHWTGSELVEVAERNGVALPDDHLLCAMLDLPLGEWHPLLVGQ